MKNKIENPKVFISYAWGDKDYENLVLSFATQLVNDGIDVVIDKWDLTEGNDTYAFMEKCVNEPSITNVLILLDPAYAEKANAHKGGVGTETQIISAQVYCKVEQDRFIPIVMKRDSEGNVCKPTYLNGRLHFDLSNEEEYDFTYQRLVKTLFGVEVYAKPSVGKKPDWVDKPIETNPKMIIQYDSVKKNIPYIEKNSSYIGYLSELSNRLIEYSHQGLSDVKTPDDYIAVMSESEDIRNNYLLILKNSYYVESFKASIANFFEESANSIERNSGPRYDFALTRLHEMFIYTIAFFLKNNDYNTVGYFLGKTYFKAKDVYHSNNAASFHMFFSGPCHTKLDEAVKRRDNKDYYTGTGAYWMETIANDFCSKEQFVFADLICYNYSVFGNSDDLNDGWYWFPITYIYDNRNTSVIAFFAQKIASKEFLNSVLPIFNYESADGFITKFKEIESGDFKRQRAYRYHSYYEYAPLIAYYIKSEDIAKYR